MPQSERTNSLHRFRAGAARVLIATDVASRGLDIPNVELVVNQDIPADPDDYIHRVGRTARAGKKGDSVSIVSEKDVERILAIENHINKKMDLLEEVNDDKIIKESLSIVTAAKRESVADMEKEGFGEKRKINKRKREERTRDSKKRK